MDTVNASCRISRPTHASRRSSLARSARTGGHSLCSGGRVLAHQRCSSLCSVSKSSALSFAATIDILLRVEHQNTIVGLYGEFMAEHRRHPRPIGAALNERDHGVEVPVSAESHAPSG